ncbi:flagellar export chaperone FliS, partial [Shewanella sp. SR41-2]|nr:flagellar export chaperone FliS [Shewanella sp. SR41-2]
MRSSLQSYRKVSLDSEISVASPHRIIQMMFAVGLERLAQSRYAIENRDMNNKGLFIGKAIGIVNGLNNSLNMDEGGEIAGNLSQLYDFIIMKVTEANLKND